MGNYTSKLLFYTNETRKESNEAQTAKQQASTEDNNMCTPTLPERKVLVDPRSASAGIPRTPIEIKYTPVSVTNKIPSAIPKYLQTKQYLETDMDVVMPPLTPKKRCIPKLTDSSQLSDSDGEFLQDCLTPNIDKKHSKVLTPIDKERYNVLGLDPRSPAADFDRTPILVPKSLAKLKARSQENLIRRGSYDTDMYNPKAFYQMNTAYSIPEIQLPDITSKHSKMLNVNKCKESDTSNVLQSDNDNSANVSETKVTVENLKFKSTEEKLVSSDRTVDHEKNNTDEQDDCEDIEYNIKTMHISPLHCEQNLQDHNDKIKVWQDFSSSEENESVKTGEDRKKDEMRGKKKKDVRIDAKLILNEENVFNLGNKCRTETFKNRTPLGNRSNNEQMPKVATRSPQQLFKNKALVQQENTPPYKKYGANARNDIQWDPNSTIFI